MKKTLMVVLPCLIALAALGVFSCQDINVDADVLKAPTFTTESGTRFEPTLAVVVENPNGSADGHVIRFTSSNDLSAPPDDPTEESPLWTGDPIDETMIIKACAFHPSYRVSPVATATYYRVWTRKAPMPTARRGAAVVTMNGKIYVIGGRSGSDYPFTYYSTVEEFSPGIGTEGGSWITKASMQTTRAYAAIAVADGKIYIFGGHNDDYLDSVEEYTYASGAGGGDWVYKAPLPGTARAYASASAYDGKIYVLGGDDGSVLLDRIDEYSPADGENAGIWEVKTSLLDSRKEHLSITLEDKVYIIGGIKDAGIQKTMEVYTPTNDSISAGSNMVTERSQFGCVKLNDEIFVFGGYQDPGTPTYLHSIEKFAIGTGWIEDDFILSLGRAEMGAGSFSNEYGDYLYLFGGRTSASDQVDMVEEYTP